MDISFAGSSYNIYFDVAAILNLLIVLFAFLVHKKLPDQKTKYFLLLCVSTTCSCIVDVISALYLNGTFYISRHSLWGINILYYIFVCCIPFFFSFYALAVAECSHLIKLPFWKIMFFFPVVIEFIAILMTPGFHFIFDITVDGAYVRGPGCFLLYGLMFYQMILSVVVLFYFKENSSILNKVYLLTFLIFSLVGIMVQMFIPFLLVQHFAISASLLLVFTSLQMSEVITDGVTGLLNLKSFNLMMNVNFKRRLNFSIVSLHIEDLQFMITTFGMEGVNELLVQIAEFLKTLGPKFSVYHLETDLFCIVIPDVSPVNYSRITANIVKRFSKSWNNSLIEIKVDVRQCVIRCPHDATNNEMIIDTINTARFDARYKNDKLLFADNIDVSTRKRYTYIEQLVKNAIQEHRIMVYYQPIFNPVTQKICGAEALVRMKDREGNFISPDEFIPIAEQDGFILRIGLFVYEEVCRFISSNHLMDYGIQMIDVNLSVAQCMQTRISEEFNEILQSYNLPPSILNLEITETAVAHTPELLYSNMNKFKKLGFGCSLDDYGTGYANLSYMLHMPFNMIKIDKEIVWSAMEDEKAYVMLVGIIDMIHKLGMQTVAEGVETQEMVDSLTKLQCNYLQGYYYSRPIPEDDFIKLICAHNQVEEIRNEEIIFRTVDMDISDVEELEELEEV